MVKDPMPRLVELPRTLAIQEQQVLIPGSLKVVNHVDFPFGPHSAAVLPGKFLTHVEPKC
jgi:hypothetical protein